jgi:hypothetical protein
VRVSLSTGFGQLDVNDPPIPAIDVSLDLALIFQMVEQFRDRRNGDVAAIGDFANRKRAVSHEKVQNEELGLGEPGRGYG